jgi:hypothetical protein
MPLKTCERCGDQKLELVLYGPTGRKRSQGFCRDCHELSVRQASNQTDYELLNRAVYNKTHRSRASLRRGRGPE